MHTPSESNSRERARTPTSFGVLSVLAIADHSTYELTRQMRNSLHYLWPRAESNVYAEPKRLVAAGLADVREEWRGKRRRTVYSITDAGRAALAGWLAWPSARQRYESEALLKVLFGENGTKDDLLASIGAIREEALAAIEHFDRAVDPYEQGGGEHPQRFALSALAARLLVEQFATTARWAAWAEEVVSGWNSPSIDDVDWGVATMRDAGQPFTLPADPVHGARRPRVAPRGAPPTETNG